VRKLIGAFRSACFELCLWVFRSSLQLFELRILKNIKRLLRVSRDLQFYDKHVGVSVWALVALKVDYFISFDKLSHGNYSKFSYFRYDFKIKNERFIEPSHLF
jgi:hypothetical protein